MCNVTSKIETILANKAAFFTAERNQGTDCFRILNGNREGFPGLVVEQYGNTLVMQVFSGECELSEPDLLRIAEALMRQTGACSVYKKIFVTDRSHQAATEDYYSEKPFLGEPASEKMVCHERGLQYEIQPYAGYSTGLFLDQRENRAYLAELSQHKTVLNLFAYTCAFSVACARHQAITTSIDLSRKYLEWGKRNFELNTLPVQDHRFVAQDCFEFLQRSIKKQNFFDLVIVDPPSFSRSKEAGVFSIKKDLAHLLELASAVVAPQGHLFFSTNFSEWNQERFLGVSQRILTAFGKWKWERMPALPKDTANGRIPLSYWMATKL